MTYQEEIREIVENNPANKEVIRYRILNKNGQIYSQQLGWVDSNTEVYGHLFTKEQVAPVLRTLYVNGFTESYSKVDIVGTLFVSVLHSPFNNPITMIKLFFFLLFMTIVISFMYKLDIPTALYDHMAKSLYK